MSKDAARRFGPVAYASSAWRSPGRSRANAAVGEGSASKATRTPAIGDGPGRPSGTRYQFWPRKTCAVTASAGRSVGRGAEGVALGDADRPETSGWTVAGV